MSFEKLPFEIVEADPEIRRKYFPNCSNFKEGVLVGPKKYFLLPSYKRHGLDIYNFEARKNDVYLTGYIRSGTTLHCEMVWLIGHDLDYEAASKEVMDDRFPHIDFAILRGDIGNFKSLDDIKNRKDQRFIKAHLPLSLLPPSIFQSGSKVIYCARNPKDVIVSGYHAFQFFQTPESVASFEEYFRAIKHNWGFFLPYFEHVKEAWERRNDSNFLFLFYEDTMKDKRNTIKKVANFLEKEMTEEQVDKLVDHLDIKNFKKNKSVNLDHMKDAGNIRGKGDFIRKGGSGGWKEYFVGDLAREVDEWIMDNLKDTDLTFSDM